MESLPLHSCKDVHLSKCNQDSQTVLHSEERPEVDSDSLPDTLFLRAVSKAATILLCHEVETLRTILLIVVRSLTERDFLMHLLSKHRAALTLLVHCVAVWQSLTVDQDCQGLCPKQSSPWWW